MEVNSERRLRWKQSGEETRMSEDSAFEFAVEQS